MNAQGPRLVVAIAGPTAGGKAALARAVADRTGAILISCDSMKVYKGMTIGTAKPRGAERESFDWRGLDLAEPWEDFDTAAWLAVAEAALEEAAAAGRPALVSGGTSLYLKALTEGMFEGPGKDLALRARLREEEACAPGALHRRLEEVDPVSAARLHPHDLRRVVRALEVFELGGRPISALQTQFGGAAPRHPRRLFFVKRPREDMDARIDARVDGMLEAGWLEECEALRALPRPLARGPAQAIGYAQLLRVIAGEQSLTEATEEVKRKTRRFARRQLTWEKHFADATGLEASESGWPTAAAIAAVVAALEGGG